MTKKIDVHIHTSMWENAQIQPHVVLANTGQIREIYKRKNIEKGFLLPLISPEYRFCVQTNEEMEYIAKNNADVFYWFCNVDPRMCENNSKSDLSYMLEHYKKRGAIGVGEVTANLYADDPLMENLFYHCGEMDMPVTIHIAQYKYNSYGIIDELGLPRLEKILKKYPKVKILGHSQCFWSEISADVDETTRNRYPKGKVKEGRIVELMRNYPNLYCDVSAGSGCNAMTRDPDFAYGFIEEFSDRLMYGTDVCTAKWDNNFAEWLDESFENGNICEENYRKICRENAIKLFKLMEE